MAIWYFALVDERAVKRRVILGPATCRADTTRHPALPFPRSFPGRRQRRFAVSWGFTAGDRKMQEYRAYVIGRDGHIELRFELFCVDDNAARERAWQLVDDRDVELWRGEHRIETFKVTRH
jgi:hypothetical protein